MAIFMQLLVSVVAVVMGGLILRWLK